MKHYLLLAIIFSTSFCNSSRKITGESKGTSNGTAIIAHRGAWKKNGYPENSIAALREAIRLNCYGSEFDVRMTADDSLVINHDPAYNKLTIEKTTFAELTRTPLPNGERLPTLREYILAGASNNTTTKLICEIKPSGTGKEHAKKIVNKTVQLVHDLGAAHMTIYISFDYDMLKEIRRIDPAAPTQYLDGNKSPEQLKADGISGADYHYSVFLNNPAWITRAKTNNIELNAWTVNDAPTMDWLLSYHFNQITTNEPELMAERVKLFSANNWQLAWSDEFNYRGLPDSAKWNYDVGGHGWGNNELQYYTDADTATAMVKNGKLYITAIKQKKENNPWTSARLVTKYKGDWLYGRIEVSAKLPAGRGMWPAIWMLPTDWLYGGWPESGEIDIMEHVGFNPDTVFSSVHTKSFNHVIGTQKTKGIKVNNPYNSFHVYAAEWFADRIDFYLDDQLFLTFKNTRKGWEEWPFDKRFHLILNIAAGGNWGAMKGMDERINSAVMEVDYVRVYQKLSVK